MILNFTQGGGAYVNCGCSREVDDEAPKFVDIFH